MDFIFQLGGVERPPAEQAVEFHTEEGGRTIISGRVHVDDRSCSSTRSSATTSRRSGADDDATPKLTIPSLNMVTTAADARRSTRRYPDLDEFWADLTAAYVAQIKASASSAARTSSSTTRASRHQRPAQREQIAARGDDPEHQHVVFIRHITTRSHRPAGMTITTHLCRGNFRSAWVAEGSYDFVAEALFNELEVDGFFLECDDERSGGFEPLRFLPKGKVVVLGLVTTKRGRARAEGRAEAPDRGGSDVRRRRPALPLAAVRLRVDGRGQRPHARAAGGQAPPRRGNGRRGLGRLRTVRDATFDVFRRRGLTTLFANPGSTEIPLLSGLPDDLRFVLGLHEASVVGLATGLAIATAEPALASCTRRRGWATRSARSRPPA